MKPSHRPVAVFAALLALSFAGSAASEEIELAPRYRAGDSYALSLRTTSQTKLRSKGPQRVPFEEAVELFYDANVVILEVDTAGRPLRERHEGVTLRFERPDESGSLFRPDARFEVRRDADGDVQLFANEKRVDRSIEKIVAGLLANQFEYTLGPALFAPGRAVEIGESWNLDPSLARRFLREHGMRVIDFDGAATATLARQEGEGDERVNVIVYRIPVTRWEPTEMPPNSLAANSEALVEGEIRLGPNGSALRDSSKLVMSVNGVVTAPGVAAPLPWSLASSKSAEQTTRIVRKSLAANF